MAQDLGAEVQRLVNALNGLDAEDARDQVYRREVFHLCAACYARWIESPV